MGSASARTSATRRQARAAGSLLEHAIRAEAGVGRAETDALLERAGPDRVVTAAAFHRVGGYVHRLLDNEPSSAAREVLRALTPRLHADVARHLVTVADLDTVQGALHAIGVDPVVFKGPVLSEHAHGSPAFRAYSDLDVLVPGPALPACLEALRVAGAEMLDRNWTLLAAQQPGEIHLRMPRGTVLDLHWHLLNEPETRDTFRVDIGRIMGRVRTIQVAGRAVTTLSDVDTVLHVAAHAVLSGGDRLIWIKDLERCIATDRPDWDAVLAEARRWGMSTILGTALWRAKRFGGSDVPDDVLTAATPSRVWNGISRAVATVTPPSTTVGGGSVDRLVCRGTRSTLAASLRELAVRTGSWAGSAVSRSDGREERLLLDPSRPTSMFHASGGDGHRATYLEAARDAWT